MGLLDNILGSLVGSEKSNSENNLLASVATLLTQGGGIDGLMSKFSAHGLGDLVKGWISTGPNPPASAEQIQKVFGAEQLQQVAAKVGIDPSQISGQIAQILPQLVDKLTPNGQSVSGNALEQGLASLLQGGLGKLLGR